MTAPVSVQLTYGQTKFEFPREQVYFSFPSGRLGYDCESCGAQCCRGHGYTAAAGQELSAQLFRGPAIQMFMDEDAASSGRLYHVKNLPPGCFFLTENGHCGVQIEQGYHAKPETCRLFPSNYIRRLGAHLIVAPHPTLCPLQVLDASRSTDDSAHDRLFDDLAASGVVARVPEVTAQCQDLIGLIRLERTLTAEAQRELEHGDGRPVVRAQIAESEVFLGRQRPADAAIDDMLDRYERLLEEVFGLMPPREHWHAPTVARTVLATTPVLRSRILFRDVEGSSPGRLGDLERIPYVMLGLHMLVAMAHQAGLRQITYNTVMELFRLYHPLLALISYVDCPMTWKPDARVDWPLGADHENEACYLAVVRRLLHRERRGRETLGTILRNHLTGSGLQRLKLLKQLAHRLADRIQPFADARTRSQSGAVRTSIQHWALERLDPDILLWYAARAPRATARRERWRRQRSVRGALSRFVSTCIGSDIRSWIGGLRMFADDLAMCGTRACTPAASPPAS